MGTAAMVIAGRIQVEKDLAIAAVRGRGRRRETQTDRFTYWIAARRTGVVCVAMHSNVTTSGGLPEFLCQ